MKRVNKFCFGAIYNGRLWEKELRVSALNIIAIYTAAVPEQIQTIYTAAGCHHIIAFYTAAVPEQIQTIYTAAVCQHKIAIYTAAI